MNATVIPFKAKTQPAPEVRCSCRPNRLCYPHRLTNLGDLLRRQQDHYSGELLIPGIALDVAVADALAVIDSIAAECLPDHERTAR